MGRSRAVGLLLVSVAAGMTGAVGAASPAPHHASLPIANRGGTMVVKVTDFDPAREKVVSAALRQGAELVNAHTQVNFEGRKLGRLRFRMASDRLALLLPEVRVVCQLYSENVHTGESLSEAA